MFSKLLVQNKDGNSVLRSIPTNITDQSFNKKNVKKNYIDLDTFIAINVEMAHKIVHTFVKPSENLEY